MKIVSLFSGAGGLDLGLIKAGHEIVWANDNDPHAVETYKYNIGPHAVLGDIKDIKTKDIPECDVVVGGFPCQGFSVANTARSSSDSRNKLYLELLRVITDKQPAFFLAENVKGLLSLEKGKVFEIILKDFNSLGYRVQYKVLNAAHFGVPQRRERLIIVGVRNDIDYKYEFPKQTHISPDKSDELGLLPWVSIGSALKHVPEPEEAPDLPNHTYSKYKLRFNGYIGNRLIDPNLPAPTVTARGDNKGGVVVLHHPKNHRRMSARELALTQSFPMDFLFCSPQSISYRLIGNAVPPLLGEVIGKSLPLNLPKA